MADFVAISGKMEDRAIEFVDHLHEHFVDPVRVQRARYQAPNHPGFSAEMHRDSLKNHLFPHGSAWQEERTARMADSHCASPK
jgi:L-fuconate dehydratase